jgi:hypothetical protein
MSAHPITLAPLIATLPLVAACTADKDEPRGDAAVALRSRGDAWRLRAAVPRHRAGRAAPHRAPDEAAHPGRLMARVLERRSD